MINCVEQIREINIDNSIFNDIIDCTYVILCCGKNPKRLNNVETQIKKLRPSYKVKLIYNKGYNNCPLSVSVNNDLVNIQAFVFKDSLLNGYKRILYLEDDFELKDEINDKDVNSIVNFVNDNDPEVYGLGNVGYPCPISIFKKHQKMLFNFMAMCHAVFYNDKYMNNYLEFYNKNIGNKYIGIDSINMMLSNISNYRYYKPLVYQKFIETENRKDGWKNQTNIILHKITMIFIKLFRLDKQIEPGWTIFYFLPYMLYFICIILILIFFKKKYFK